MSFSGPSPGRCSVWRLPIILFYLIRQRLRVKSVTTLLFWENLAPKVHNLPLWRKLRRLRLAVAAIAFARAAGDGDGAADFAGAIDGGVVAHSRARSVGHDGGEIGNRYALAAGQGHGVAENRRDGFWRRGDGDSCGRSAARSFAVDGPQGDLRKAIEKAELSPNVTDIRPTLRLARNLVLSHPAPPLN